MAKNDEVGIPGGVPVAFGHWIIQELIRQLINPMQNKRKQMIE
jgi:hypothetical protein